MKKIIYATLISAFFSISFVSYTSWWQIQNLGWLRDLIYLEDNEASPCKDQHQGYGRLYKHGCFVNPVSVVQSVGEVIDKAYQGTKTSERENSELLNAVNFLKSWAKEKKYKEKTLLLAPYNFSWSKYGLEPGWVSGMAQGHIIEAMVATYKITDDESYLETAENFANAFYVPVKNGGVTVQTENGPWFEEYAQPGKKPSFALNGHIFALEGLYRLAHYRPKYKNIIYKAVNTTEKKIKNYDAGWWSKYDLRGTMANQKYHHIHIKQLHWLGIEFGSKKLDSFGQDFLWAQLGPFSSILRIIYSPSRFLFFILALNFSFLFITIIICAKLYNKKRNDDES